MLLFPLMVCLFATPAWGNEPLYSEDSKVIYLQEKVRGILRRAVQLFPPCTKGHSPCAAPLRHVVRATGIRQGGHGLGRLVLAGRILCTLVSVYAAWSPVVES